MIWNFICFKCKKFKSHGRLQKDGRYVCLDCLYKLKGEDNGEEKEI